MGRAMGLVVGITVTGGGMSDSRSVCTSLVKASGEDASRESMESSIFFLLELVLCHILVKETERQVLIKRWFIQYNSGRVSNIGDRTKKALEAGCTVALYVNLRFLRRRQDPGWTGR